MITDIKIVDGYKEEFAFIDLRTLEGRETICFTWFTANNIMENNSWWRSEDLSRFGIWELTYAISHEEIHSVLVREFGEEVSKQYDNVAKEAIYRMELINRLERSLEDMGLK